MMVTVWLFLIFGTSHQVVDFFPTRADCEQFRANVQQMIDVQGVGRVSDCMPRNIVLAAIR